MAKDGPLDKLGNTDRPADASPAMPVENAAPNSEALASDASAPAAGASPRGGKRRVRIGSRRGAVHEGPRRYLVEVWLGEEFAQVVQLWVGNSFKRLCVRALDAYCRHGCPALPTFGSKRARPIVTERVALTVPLEYYEVEAAMLVARDRGLDVAQSAWLPRFLADAMIWFVAVNLPDIDLVPHGRDYSKEAARGV